MAQVPSFIEVEYPLELAYGSKGRLTFPVDVTEGDSGLERRTLRWANGRHTFDAATGITSMDDLARLKRFYYAVGGKAYGFRFRSASDQSSAENGRDAPRAFDQKLGKGTGAKTVWQLFKSYEEGPITRNRPIVKPVDGSVLVAVGGQVLTGGYSVDPTTGLLTLAAPPPEGIVVTCGFRFDIPCRFDGDFEESWDDYELGTATLPIVEIKQRLAGGGVS